MDGGGRTIFAFQDNMAGANVVIDNLVIQNYKAASQRGAIDAGSGGWKIRNSVIRNNGGAGISLGGNSNVVEHNKILSNDQIGLKIQSSSGSVVRGNEIAHNNSAGNYDMSWEAGGTKFLKTHNLAVLGNNVHHNRGAGLWTDHDNHGTRYENNTVVDNAGPGIFHEISGSAVIKNNTVRNNAHGFYIGGILVANSHDVLVEGNTLSGNDGGIVGLQDNRPPWNTVNLTVRNNNVAYSTGVSGVVYNGGTDVTASGTIWFSNNTYTLASSTPFRWKNSNLSISQWQALGQDTNSTFK